MYNVPGPGTYDPIKKRLGGKVRIGSSKRRPLCETKNTPGPGNYKTRGKFDGPKYGITPKRAEMQGNTIVPGPGRYRPSVK